jgi:hypothetical protein
MLTRWLCSTDIETEIVVDGIATIDGETDQ